MEFLQTAKKAALKSGEVLLSHRRSKLQSITKDNNIRNYVTQADLDSQRQINNLIKETYPDHAILGEELSHGDLDAAQYGWIIDPLDGTTNFARGLDNISISIALIYQREVIVGVVYNPIKQELFYAQKGKGAYLNEDADKLIVSSTNKLDRSIVTQNLGYSDHDRHLQAQILDKLIPKTESIRLHNCASLDLCYLAQGRLDGYVLNFLPPWDFAAGALIVQEAGGLVTTFDNKPWSVKETRHIASNGLIHQELIDLVNS